MNEEPQVAIVAPNIARFSIVAALNGQECINTLDLLATPADPGAGDREDALYDIAGDILNNWHDHLLPLLQPEYQALEVRWVDLDSADGSTGSRNSTSAETWPSPGTQSGFVMPNMVAMRVRKGIVGRRNVRAGSLFIGGVSEGYTLDTAPNELDPAAIAAMNEALEDFKDGVQEIANGWDRHFVVVHVIGGTYEGYSRLTTFQTQRQLGTMRRRMPGYGS